MIKRFITLLLVTVFVAGAALPALAATVTKSFSEAQMNTIFLSLLPADLANMVTNPRLDLQSGRVVITATMKAPYAGRSLRVVVVPVNSGGISWRVASISIGGVGLPAAVRNTLTTQVLAAWAACLAAYGATGVTAVTITGTGITFTYTTP